MKLAVMIPRFQILSGDHSASQEDNESRHSGDVRDLIAKPLRPSPAQEFEAEREDPYRGIDLNEATSAVRSATTISSKVTRNAALTRHN